MVIRVEYYIPKEYFIKYKRKFKKLLFPLEFDVCVLKFEKRMNCHEIAKKMDLAIFDSEKVVKSLL